MSDKPKLFIQNIKNPKITFEVLKFDPATKLGTLKGEYGAEFQRNLTKDALTKYGYVVVNEEQMLANQAPSPATLQKALDRVEKGSRKKAEA